MKRAALYMRVSTVDQHPETQLHDLRQMAAQRGDQIVQEYTDRISGTKAKRPGLGQMITDARRGRFDVVRDQVLGRGFRQIAKIHRISTATVQRVLNEHATTKVEKSA